MALGFAVLSAYFHRHTRRVPMLLSVLYLFAFACFLLAILKAIFGF